MKNTHKSKKLTDMRRIDGNFQIIWKPSLVNPGEMYKSVKILGQNHETFHTYYNTYKGYTYSYI